MSDQESLDNNTESAEAAEIERLRIIETVIELALELSESGEAFPFPGIKPEIYEQIKAEQEEYPGYATPIDELLVRFQNEGVKIVLTKDPSAGDFMLLPGGSDDIYSDCLMPGNLLLDGDIHTTLHELLSRKELIKKERSRP